MKVCLAAFCAEDVLFTALGCDICLASGSFAGAQSLSGAQDCSEGTAIAGLVAAQHPQGHPSHFGPPAPGRPASIQNMRQMCSQCISRISRHFCILEKLLINRPFCLPRMPPGSRVLAVYPYLCPKCYWDAPLSRAETDS